MRLQRVPAAEVDPVESFGSNNTICNLNLTMSLSLENVSSVRQDSRERTNSLIRDMSSVEEHWTSSGSNDIGNIPEPSNQATYVF